MFSHVGLSAVASGKIRLISGFPRCEVAENRAILGYYAASSGNFLPTFRDNLLVPFRILDPLKIGPIGFPEASVRNYPYSLCNNKEERGPGFRLVDLGLTGLGWTTTVVTECKKGKAIPLQAWTGG